MLVGVLNTDIDEVWPIVSPLLQKAVDKGQGDFLLQDYYEALLLRNMQLWVWKPEEKITAACVTQILSYPRRKVCQILLLGGTGLKDWLKKENSLVEWAREQGCSQMEGFARDGWLGVLPHWVKCWNTIRRNIK